MAAPQVSAIAGYFDLYWSAAGESVVSGLGSTGPEGITQTLEYNVEEIMSDALGPKTVVDGIHQGGNCILQFVLQEVAIAQTRRFLSPWTEDQGSPNYGDGLVGIPGSLMSAYCGYLEAMPRTGTPAAGYNASGGSGRRYFGMAVGPRVEFLDNP